MSPNLYDVLDVDETASADEIRAAWKSAIADLDPTDRRFRAYSDAATVLLDEDRRAAYDAGLAEQRAAAEGPAEEGTGPVVLTKPAAPDAEVTELDTEPATPATAPAEPEPPVDPAAAGGGPPTWAIAAAAVAAVAAVVLAVFALRTPDVKAQEEATAKADQTSADVQQLVADKIVPALSYDYRTMPKNLADLQQYLTPEMAAKQANDWKAFTPEAKAQKIIAVSHTPVDPPNVPGTGLTRLSEDGTRAVVVALIDQDVRKQATSPYTLKAWATFVLVKDADSGHWLVQQICTDRVCD